MDIVGADHARRLAGREIIRHAAADNDDVTGNQRGGGLLIVTRFDFTHPDAQIDDTAIAESLTGLAGIGVNRDKTGIGGRQEQTPGAGGRLNVTRGGGLGVAVFVIAETAAALPVWRGGFCIIAPLFFSAIDIQRQHFAVRRTDIQRIADLQRGVLVFRAGTVALRDIAGMGDPGNLQLVNVLFVNLIKGGKAVAVGGVTPVLPVLLLFARSNRFDRYGLRSADQRL